MDKISTYEYSNVIELLKRIYGTPRNMILGTIKKDFDSSEIKLSEPAMADLKMFTEKVVIEEDGKTPVQQLKWLVDENVNTAFRNTQTMINELYNISLYYTNIEEQYINHIQDAMAVVSLLAGSEIKIESEADKYVDTKSGDHIEYTYYQKIYKISQTNMPTKYLSIWYDSHSLSGDIPLVNDFDQYNQCVGLQFVTPYEKTVVYYS